MFNGGGSDTRSANTHHRTVMNTASTDSRSIELTDAMWDAISSAMADYADYGDQEATIADEIQMRIAAEYRSAK